MQINDPEIQNKAIKIKNKIERLIEQGFIEDAIEALDKYDTIVHWDADSYSMRAVIKIMQNKYDDAENILLNALEREPFNFDLNYNLGYLYEQKGLYLKALETYEKALFNIKVLGKQIIAMEAINNLESQYKDVIQSQLNLTNKKEYIMDNSNLILHIMYDSQYCNKLIKFINKSFDNKKHFFIIVSSIGYDLKFVNIDGISNIRILYIPQDINEFLGYINMSSKIFVHYLFDYFCQIICHYNINKPIYWVVWGGDLYNYIKIKQYDELTYNFLSTNGYKIDLIERNDPAIYYRKAAIRRIDYFLCGFEEADLDYALVRKSFISYAKHIPFMYPNPVDFLLLEESNRVIPEKYNFKLKFNFVVLAGNSANPSNNHLDILNMLKDKKYKEFCIVMPLSYGFNNDYINSVISEGKHIFGERFIPITEYLSSEEYYQILKQSDIAIYNHNRQQAIGNIIILLYLGKRVYIKDSLTTYSFLKSLGLSIYDISSLDIENVKSLDEKTIRKNKTILLEKFSETAVYKNLKNLNY